MIRKTLVFAPMLTTMLGAPALPITSKFVTTLPAPGTHCVGATTAFKVTCGGVATRAYTIPKWSGQKEPDPLSSGPTTSLRAWLFRSVCNGAAR